MSERPPANKRWTAALDATRLESVKTALIEKRGNVLRAAEALGLSRSHLSRMAAAKSLGRRFVGFETDEKMCRKAIEKFKLGDLK